jgi:hypothetical protein
MKQTMKIKMKQRRFSLSRLIRRPVKHPRLYMWVHGGLPCVYLFALLIASNQAFFYVGRDRNWPIWGAIAMAVVGVVHGLFVGRWCAFHIRKVADRISEIDLEHIDLTDNGEALEVGAGWRNMRGTVAVHEGTGRLHRVRMEWVDFLIHSETKECRMVRSSDPKLAGGVMEVPNE